MYRKIILLSIMGFLVSMSVSATNLNKTVNEKIKQAKQQDICCLPVVEIGGGATSGMGYCYYAKDGYLSARIEDDELRNEANKYIGWYPVCKDAWCSFNRGLHIDYYRTDKTGRVLKKEQQKFEKDVIGFINSVPAFQVSNTGERNIWAGQKKPAACKIDVDFNMELLGLICAMKNHGNKEISYISHDELQDVVASLSEGDYDRYVFSMAA
ncbi:MAG: hypothetical protein J5601_04975 [Elusimicrobiaceae bacterium]|nr:hypothetical protein [Elusimicrobiaceae bacterium]